MKRCKHCGMVNNAVCTRHEVVEVENEFQLSTERIAVIQRSINHSISFVLDAQLDMLQDAPIIGWSIETRIGRDLGNCYREIEEAEKLLCKARNYLATLK